MSRQAPGRKDYVTLWTKEGKVRLQKKHNYVLHNQRDTLHFQS